MTTIRWPRFTNDARGRYRANHREVRERVRAIVRTGQPIEQARSEVYRELGHWLGGRWSQPASPEAQAALRIVTGQLRRDPLEIRAEVLPRVRSWAMPADQLRASVALAMRCTRPTL